MEQSDIIKIYLIFTLIKYFLYKSFFENVLIVSILLKSNLMCKCIYLKSIN